MLGLAVALLRSDDLNLEDDAGRGGSLVKSDDFMIFF
jgi:hypothetical protein